MLIIPGTVVLIFVLSFGFSFVFLPEKDVSIERQEPVEDFAEEKEDSPEYEQLRRGILGPDEDPLSEEGPLAVPDLK